MNWLYRKIDGNLYKKNKEQVIASMSLCIFSIFVSLLHLLFLAVFVITDVPEMAFMNFTSFLCYLFIMYMILVKDKVLFSVYTLTLSFLYYVLWSSYFLGYEKYAVIILPMIIICIYSIYELNIKHLVITILMVAFSYLMLLYFKYTVQPRYKGELMYIEIVNVLIAFSASLFVLHANKLSRMYLQKLDAQKIERLSKEANIDFLTGLWNRRYISSNFENRDTFHTYYIVLADVDFFKKVNDIYGHDTGDYILQQISKLFLDMFEEPDIVCRWGGEEFMFILKEENKNIVSEKLEKLRLLIENKNFEYKNKIIKLTISFGVQHIDEKIKFEDAIIYADEALYYAKDNGRNQVVFYNNIPDALSHR